MKYVLLLIFSFSISWSAENYDKDASPQDLMIVSKIAGMCGTFRQMTVFQESTKMTGGDEFIVRFIHTEIARLGWTEKKFFKNCEMAASTYDLYMNGFEQMEKEEKAK